MTALDQIHDNCADNAFGSGWDVAGRTSSGGAGLAAEQNGRIELPVGAAASGTTTSRLMRTETFGGAGVLELDVALPAPADAAAGMHDVDNGNWRLTAFLLTAAGTHWLELSVAHSNGGTSMYVYNQASSAMVWGPVGFAGLARKLRLGFTAQRQLVAQVVSTEVTTGPAAAALPASMFTDGGGGFDFAAYRLLFEARAFAAKPGVIALDNVNGTTGDGGQVGAAGAVTGIAANGTALGAVAPGAFVDREVTLTGTGDLGTLVLTPGDARYTAAIQGTPTTPTPTTKVFVVRVTAAPGAAPGNGTVLVESALDPTVELTLAGTVSGATTIALSPAGRDLALGEAATYTVSQDGFAPLGAWEVAQEVGCDTVLLSPNTIQVTKEAGSTWSLVVRNVARPAITATVGGGLASAPPQPALRVRDLSGAVIANGGTLALTLQAGTGASAARFVVDNGVPGSDTDALTGLAIGVLGGGALPAWLADATLDSDVPAAMGTLALAAAADVPPQAPAPVTLRITSTRPGESTPWKVFDLVVTLAVTAAPAASAFTTQHEAQLARGAAIAEYLLYWVARLEANVLPRADVRTDMALAVDQTPVNLKPAGAAAAGAQARAALLPEVQAVGADAAAARARALALPDGAAVRARIDEALAASDLGLTPAQHAAIATAVAARLQALDAQQVPGAVVAQTVEVDALCADGVTPGRQTLGYDADGALVSRTAVMAVEA